MPSGSFPYISRLGTLFEVQYWQAEDGVIRYDFKQINKAHETVKVPKRAENLSEQEASASLVMLGIGLVVGGGALVYALHIESEISVKMH